MATQSPKSYKTSHVPSTNTSYIPYRSYFSRELNFADSLPILRLSVKIETLNILV